MGEKRHDIKRLTSCGATRTILGLRSSAFPRCGSAERFWKPDSLLSIQKSPILWRAQDGAPFACQEVRVKTANGPVKLSIHILVVDDEPLMAQSLADALAAEGYEIDVAVNGQRALEKIKDHTYDLILSDLRMPGLDGVGLYRELERWQPNLRRRMIFVTGAIEHPDYLRIKGSTRRSRDAEEAANPIVGIAPAQRSLEAASSCS